ncbi:hypothetical protein WOLCODRAFT_139286 [Wolfiporia cocos MD-104 SS10]|uniref:Uncharacterized protein n=1 Tax=Wolfiporia cocos (strain MD-104) TaxID=742152 RepID=A0A2H3JSD2_WOLCO|nr:hypothetical protein WOLCODRAFT_139286 [Wolfiporia cocos MD-104 SS10]
MLAAPVPQYMSNRAAGKARAADVGIRARIVAAQSTARESRSGPEPFALSASHLAPRYSAIDLRPNEIREAMNAKQIASLCRPVLKPQVRGRPSQADLEQGNMYVNWIRKSVLDKVPTMNDRDIPDEQMPEYRMAFDLLWGYVFEMDSVLHIYAGWMAEETIRQLIVATAMVKQQKVYLSSRNQRFIMDLQAVHLFLHMMETTRQAITQRVHGKVTSPIHPTMTSTTSCVPMRCDSATPVPRTTVHSAKA